MISLPQKISLKKVRTSFVKRKSTKDSDQNDEDEENELIMAALASDIRTAFLPQEDQHLSRSIGIIESRRKIYADYSHVNQIRSVSYTEVLHHKLTRSLILHLENNINLFVNPWQYTVKRLESYGDLELATWARRIKRYNENYKKTMDKYFDMLTSQDLEVIRQLNKAKKLASDALQNIEDNNRYFVKSTMLYDHESANFIAMTFSECLFKEMGFTMETFTEWIKKNGIPPVSAKDSKSNIEFCSAFWESMIDAFQTYTEIHEGPIVIVCSDGSRKKMKIKSVCVVEPGAEGIFKHHYYLFNTCDKESFEEMENEASVNSQSKLKAYKHETSKDNEEGLGPIQAE